MRANVVQKLGSVAAATVLFATAAAQSPSNHEPNSGLSTLIEIIAEDGSQMGLLTTWTSQGPVQESMSADAFLETLSWTTGREANLPAPTRNYGVGYGTADSGCPTAVLLVIHFGTPGSGFFPISQSQDIAQPVDSPCSKPAESLWLASFLDYPFFYSCGLAHWVLATGTTDEGWLCNTGAMTAHGWGVARSYTNFFGTVDTFEGTGPVVVSSGPSTWIPPVT